MALISSKPLGTLIRVADSDGGNGAVDNAEKLEGHNAECFNCGVSI